MTSVERIVYNLHTRKPVWYGFSSHVEYVTALKQADLHGYIQLSAPKSTYLWEVTETGRQLLREGM